MEVILWVLAFFSTSAHSLRLREVKGLPVAPAKASGATEGFIRRRSRIGGVSIHRCGWGGGFCKDDPFLGTSKR